MIIGDLGGSHDGAALEVTAVVVAVVVVPAVLCGQVAGNIHIVASSPAHTSVWWCDGAGPTDMRTRCTHSGYSCRNSSQWFCWSCALASRFAKTSRALVSHCSSSSSEILSGDLHQSSYGTRRWGDPATPYERVRSYCQWLTR
jgi:hypothetical protein